MGFLNTSCSFARFRILDAVDDDLILQIPELLKKFAFKDIDDLPEMQAFGWTSFEDMLDGQWQAAPPHKGQYLVFSLRLDTRRIPPAVIKKHTAIAMAQERQKNGEAGQKFISRERKKELKEQVTLKLLQRFLPVPAEFNVIWNLQNHEIWFASIQSRMIDLFIEFFLNSFGLHIEQLTPYSLALAIVGEQAAGQLNMLEETQFSPQKGTA